MSLAIMQLEMKKWHPRPLLWALWALCFTCISVFYYRLCVEYLHLSQKSLLHVSASPSVLLEIVKPLSSWSIVLLSLLIPIFTTSAFSQEYRQHTFILWANSTRTARSIVFGKFFGIVLFPLSLVFVEFMMLSILAFEMKMDFAWLLCSSLSILFITACVTAFGLFVSSVSSNPLAAMTLTYIGTLSWMVLEWLNPFPKEWSFISQHLCLLSHSYHLLNGIFLSTDFAYYALFCIFWLTLTQLIISKKLKQYDN